MILPLLAILSAQIADQASAQQSPSEPDIVVTARERSIRKLASAITPDLSNDSPMGRFSTGVCFEVLGLPPGYATSIRSRLIENARSAGAPLAGESCSPNALVIFVKDGKSELTNIAARRPYLLDSLSDIDRSRLMAEPGPVRAWSNSNVRGSDGRQIDHELKLRGAVMSRIVLSIRRDLLSSVVLIDIRAIHGLSLQQLADFATMRLLAQTRSNGIKSSDTILSLFSIDRSAAPTSLTPFDRAYLKVCYAGFGNERVGMKLGRIASMLRKRR